MSAERNAIPMPNGDQQKCILQRASRAGVFCNCNYMKTVSRGFGSNLGSIKNNFYMNPPLDSFYADKLFTVFLFVWKEFFCGSFNFFVAKLSFI